MNAGRSKVEAEGMCRVCGLGGSDVLDSAHTWDRSLGSSGFDDPDLIVPLCSAIKGSPDGCHDAYDAHRLNLLPYLTPTEQVALVRAAGSIERARDRARGRGLTGAPESFDLGPFGV